MNVLAAASLLVASLAPPPTHARNLSRFPSPSVSCEYEQLSRRHSKAADERFAPHPFGFEKMMAADLEWRYQCWKWLRLAHNAKNVGASEDAVREYLRALRDLLGEEAYLRGEMPFPVPLHLYADVTDSPAPRMMEVLP